MTEDLDEASRSRRQFKKAVIIFAVVEFIVIVLVMIYMVRK